MSFILEKIRRQTARILLYVKALCKWILVSAIVGILCGFLGSAFHIGVSKATSLRLTYPWLLWGFPLAGILIVFLYRVFQVEGHSTNSIITEVQSGKGLKFGLIPAIFCSTILTHLCGGSAGREGAALQMGGTIGFEVGRLLKLDDRDLRTATMAGMAAFFSALFGTPLAATIFAMAVISIGLLYHAALIPCLIAALISYAISLLVGIAPTHFFVQIPVLSPLLFLKVSILAGLCAAVSCFFCDVLHRAERFMRQVFPNAILRVLVGSVFLILLSLLFPSGDYNGAGTDVIARAVEGGTTVPPAFLLKILFTVITLSAGFKGGEVVPCFFIGATFGCAVGPFLGIPPGAAAAIGLISVFCAATNCPIASTFLAIELFGSEGMLLYALSCAVCYVLSGYDGLYSSQRILYDKLKARYIDVHTNAYHEGDHTPMEQKYR